MTLKNSASATITGNDATTTIGELIGNTGTTVTAEAPFTITEGADIDKLVFNSTVKMTIGEKDVNGVIARNTKVILNEFKDNNGADIANTRDYVNIVTSGEKSAIICCKQQAIYESFKKYNSKKLAEQQPPKIQFILLGVCTSSDEVKNFDYAKGDSTDIQLGIYVPSDCIVNLEEEILTVALVENGGAMQVVDDLTTISRLISYGESSISSGVTENLEVESGGNVRMYGGKITNIIVEKDGNLSINSRNSDVLGNVTINGNLDLNGGKIKLSEKYVEECMCCSDTGKCQCCAEESTVKCKCSETGECHYNRIQINSDGIMNVNSGTVEVPINIAGGTLIINGGKIDGHMLIDGENNKEGILRIIDSKVVMKKSSLDIRNGRVTIENSTIDLKNEGLKLEDSESVLNLNNVDINSQGTAIEVKCGKLFVDGSTSEIKARDIGICIKGGRVEVNGGTISGARTGIEFSDGELTINKGVIKNCTTGFYQHNGQNLTINNIEICDCGAGMDIEKGTCKIYKGDIKRCSAGMVARENSEIIFGEKDKKVSCNLTSCCVGMVVEEPDTTENIKTIGINEDEVIYIKNCASGIEIYYKGNFIEPKKFEPNKIEGKIVFKKYYDINDQPTAYDYTIIANDGKLDDIKKYYNVPNGANVTLKIKTA